jgi:hypothetical protein
MDDGLSSAVRGLPPVICRPRSAVRGPSSALRGPSLSYPRTNAIWAGIGVGPLLLVSAGAQAASPGFWADLGPVQKAGLSHPLIRPEARRLREGPTDAPVGLCRRHSHLSGRARGLWGHASHPNHPDCDLDGHSRRAARPIGNPPTDPSPLAERPALPDIPRGVSLWPCGSLHAGFSSRGGMVQRSDPRRRRRELSSRLNSSGGIERGE